MSLAALQRAMLRTLFDAAPSPEDRAALVDPNVKVYRELARSRIEGLLRTAFPRSLPLLPGAVPLYLSRGAPESRFFRDLPLLFADFVLSADLPEPPHLADLVRLERARWWAMIAEERTDVVEPFDLAKCPVASATLTMLEPRWSVHLDTIAPTTDAVVVYRRKDDVVETRWASGLSGRLLRGWVKGEEPAITVAKEALTPEERATNAAALVEAISDLGATLLDGGAILGVRPAR